MDQVRRAGGNAIVRSSRISHVKSWRRRDVDAKGYDSTMVAQRVMGTAAVVITATLVGYWLFADTVRYYGIGREAAPLRIAF